jgi:hypothetical protein
MSRYRCHIGCLACKAEGDRAWLEVGPVPTALKNAPKYCRSRVPVALVLEALILPTPQTA